MNVKIDNFSDDYDDDECHIQINFQCSAAQYFNYF